MYSIVFLECITPGVPRPFHRTYLRNLLRSRQSDIVELMDICSESFSSLVDSSKDVRTFLLNPGRWCIHALSLARTI